MKSESAQDWMAGILVEYNTLLVLEHFLYTTTAGFTALAWESGGVGC